MLQDKELTAVIDTDALNEVIREFDKTKWAYDDLPPEDTSKPILAEQMLALGRGSYVRKITDEKQEIPTLKRESGMDSYSSLWNKIVDILSTIKATIQEKKAWNNKVINNAILIHQMNVAYFMKAVAFDKTVEDDLHHLKTVLEICHRLIVLDIEKILIEETPSQKPMKKQLKERQAILYRYQNVAVELMDAIAED